MDFHSRLRGQDAEAGATLVEYALMVALIAIVAFLAVTAFGISVNGLFDDAGLLGALS